MENRFDQWVDDGGANAPLVPLEGSVAQVEWAERIRQRVISEFDRVAAAFHGVALKQDPVLRTATEAVIRILEDKRDEVMRNNRAGYFIHDWQDISGQVRQLILSDPRYKATRSSEGRKR